MNREIETLVSKYTKIIHPQDTGKETNDLENTLRNLIEELILQERERIIGEIEKMRTAPPENAKTEVKDTFQTINNTISGIVMRIKTLK